MRILIVGCGVAGLSAAWALQRDGHRVVLVERGPIPNPLASSFDSHRLIRRAYGRQLGYMHMISDAWAAWQRLWDDLGQDLAVRTGALAISANDDDYIGWSLTALRHAGYEVEELSQAALTERFPMVAPEGVRIAFVDPDGGVLLASRIVRALARLVAERGATVLPYEEATGLDVDRAEVVLADGSILRGDLLIVAAGPFTPRLLPQLAGTLVPSRQVLAYVTMTDELRALWRNGPAILGTGGISGFYLVPPVAAPDGGETALKIGDHLFSLTGDPALPAEREASLEESQAVLAQVQGRLAGAHRYALERAHVCFYTVERQERFQTLPLGKAAWVMSNCSGHGFKFAACIGEAMADMVAGRRSAAALQRYVAGEIL